MILLTQAQASGVTGKSGPQADLRPLPFVLSGASNVALNGKYALPEAVLTDPAHSQFHGFLSGLPTFPTGNIQRGTPGATSTDPMISSDWLN